MEEGGSGDGFDVGLKGEGRVQDDQGLKFSVLGTDFSLEDSIGAISEISADPQKNKGEV